MQICFLLASMKRTINNAKVFSVTKKNKMRKIYCIICGKYRDFKNPRILHIFEKTVISIICSKCAN